MLNFAIFETHTQRGAPEIFMFLKYYSVQSGKYRATLQGRAVQEV